MALYVVAGRLSATRIGARVRASTIGRIAIEGAHFVFYIGWPYLALLAGAFAPRDVGLQGAPAPELLLGWTPESWARAVGQAAALGGLALTAIAVWVWQIRRAGGFAPAALGVDYATGARAVRDGVYAEAHWSFYRALPMLALGATHWAALAGLALWVLELLLAGRHAESGTHRLRLSEAVLAGMSATFFALTGGNVWVAILLQIGVRLALNGLAFAGSRQNPPDEIIV